ncbi:MAG TPA: ATP-binding protein [Verrucomicrobiae bacterium]|nr:ATP-binding protein [Verrucomicrobiae bacterium]
MIHRTFWMERVAAAWQQATVVWLTGPRRAGKTVLAQSFPDAEFLNCDLPSVAERLRDPESFYHSLKRRLVIFDEVHQLPDPSRLLKIGADEFPRLKILATGSSTLAATQKFSDSLTGRKRVVELVPVLHEELPAFGVTDVRERLWRGGLPPALLAAQHTPEFYAEWQDSYFARDVQELFRLEKRAGFLRVLALLLRQSGGMVDVAKLAAESQISRPTVMNWLDVFQITHVAHLVRPFSGGGRREIVAQPKVFGFDTGLVCFARGWDRLRTEDCGILWEHLVLDTLIAAGLPKIHFWRDKQQREVDFVAPRSRDAVDAIECKWQPQAFTTRGLAAFRENYPKGKNYVVSPLTTPGYQRVQDGLKISIVSPRELRLALG